MIKLILKMLGFVVAGYVILAVIAFPFECIGFVLILGCMCLLWCAMVLALHASHLRKGMKKGRTFKQICKEDIFIFNGQVGDPCHHGHSPLATSICQSNSSVRHTQMFSWWNDPSRRNELGNVHYDHYK